MFRTGIPNINNVVATDLQYIKENFNAIGHGVTYYVDQLNGDDNNNGSQNAPFKTLTRAISSIPIGGIGIIYVLGDYNLDLEPNHIYIRNKKIRIILKGTLSVSWHTITAGATYAQLRRVFILGKGSSIEFWIDSNNNGRIVIADNDTGAPLAGSITGLVQAMGYGRAVVAFAGFYIRVSTDNYTPIEIGADAYLMDASVWSKWDGFVVFCLTGHYAGTGREIIARGKFLRLGSITGTAVYKVSYDGGFKDGLGNPVSPVNLITGVIKGGNGVPRNVISNLIL